MQSKAKTVAEYLAELPEDRRAAISAVREAILANLDEGIEEGMSYGMIGYCIPHSLYPAGYHCNPKQPLPYAGLASQKQYMVLYIGSGESLGHGKDASGFDDWFRKEWAKTGKKLDKGKVCVRFKKLDDIPLELVGRAIRRLTLESFVEGYEKFLAEHRAAAAERKAGTAKKHPAKPMSKGKGASVAGKK